jgi:WS/DGAT C-terminal domain
MFWVPQSGHMGLGISILSYAGGVMLGIATDAGLVPDPERIVEGFKVEFEVLRKAAATQGARRRGNRASPPGRAAKRPGRPPHTVGRQAS